MLAALILAATLAANQPEPFGAISAAPMPSGGSTYYLQGGYPDVRTGWRIGVGMMELGLEGAVDIPRITAKGLATVRGTLAHSEGLTLSSDLKLGAYSVFGTRASDPTVQRSGGFSMEPGMTFSIETSWPVAFFLKMRLPLDTPFSEAGTTRMRFLFGGGAEVALASDWFVSFEGAFGPELRRGYSTPLSVDALIGVGWRLF